MDFNTRLDLASRDKENHGLGNAGAEIKAWLLGHAAILALGFRTCLVISATSAPCTQPTILVRASRNLLAVLRVAVSLIGHRCRPSAKCPTDIDTRDVTTALDENLAAANRHNVVGWSALSADIEATATATAEHGFE